MAYSALCCCSVSRNHGQLQEQNSASARRSRSGSCLGNMRAGGARFGTNDEIKTECRRNVHDGSNTISSVLSYAQEYSRTTEHVPKADDLAQSADKVQLISASFDKI